MLRVLIDKYLEGSGSLEELELYLVENLQSMLDFGGGEYNNAVNRIDVNMIRFRLGEIDEPRFMRRLFRERKNLKDIYSTTYTTTAEGNRVNYNFDFTS